MSNDTITGVDGAIVNTAGGGQVLVRRGQKLPAINNKERERLYELGAFEDTTPRERAAVMPTADPIALAAENAALREALSTVESDADGVDELRAEVATLRQEAESTADYVARLESENTGYRETVESQSAALDKAAERIVELEAGTPTAVDAGTAEAPSAEASTTKSSRKPRSGS